MSAAGVMTVETQREDSGRLLVMTVETRREDSGRLLAGYFIALILCISNYSFLSALLVFFITASKLTKIRSREKRAFEEDFKEGDVFICSLSSPTSP